MKFPTNIHPYIFLIALPVLGETILLASHNYSEGYLVDRLFPIILSVVLTLYLAWQHYSYWDKSFSRKPYFKLFHLATALIYTIFLILILATIDLNQWFGLLIQRTLVFYFLPFIIAAYVVPFLLFSHVLADSLDDLKRLLYIGSAYLIIIICLIFWWIRNNIII